MLSSDNAESLPDIIALLRSDEIVIRTRMLEINKEINAMPNPADESWIMSIPSLDNKNKTISLKNLKRLAELKKEFDNLAFAHEKNFNETKIYNIEALLKKINSVNL